MNRTKIGKGGKMKAKIAILVTSCVMAILLLLTSCGQQTATTTPTQTTTALTSAPTTAPTTQPSITTTTAPTVSGPTYGGTLVYRTNLDIVNLDPYLGSFSSATGARLWYETLFIPDLTTDPEVYPYTGTYHPWDYITGCLAESWETTDQQTWTINVRKGIHWQDIAPVNGREFTAYDIEYYFHRKLGLGSGFTKPSAFNVGLNNYASIESITATDKYTVVFQLKQRELETMRFTFESLYDAFGAREVVEAYGDTNDPRHQIGTGPFIMKDYVSASSVTADRNPNYWGYDTLYPQNQLPYLDEVRVLIIPDDATAYAALRTGKIDMLPSIDWQQAAILQKSIPTLLKQGWPTNGWAILMHVDINPFSDIRVRKAMQMSLDLPTIAESYYGGTISSEIFGAFALPGYYTPFDQWPQDVKDGFTYNPEGAKKLLADAGYPSGFKFTCVASSAGDIDFAQVIKSYLEGIGVEMEIQVMDNVTFSAYTTGDKHDTMFYQLTSNISYPPMVWINQYTSRHFKFRGHINDPVYDQMWDEVKAMVDMEQQRLQIIKMNDYATAQYYRLSTPPYNAFVMWHPWLKGYTGTRTSGGPISSPVRIMWLDQTLKKSMGF